MEAQKNTNVPNELPTIPASTHQQPSYVQPKANYLLIVIAILISAVIFGLGGYYIGQRSSINLNSNSVSKQQLSTVTPTVPSESQPTSAQPNSLPINAISEADNKILINFDVCSPTTRRIDVDFGSTTIEIQGKEGDFCKLNYGGEVENPNWDGNLPNKCRVPTNLGTMAFTKSNYGVNLSAIQQYCTN